MTLLAGKQRPDPASVVHRGDLLFQTLHPALGPAPLQEVLPSSSCPAGCCCDGQALPLTLCCTLERRLPCLALVAILGN